MAARKNVDAGSNRVLQEYIRDFSPEPADVLRSLLHHPDNWRVLISPLLQQWAVRGSVLQQQQVHTLLQEIPYLLVREIAVAEKGGDVPRAQRARQALLAVYRDPVWRPELQDNFVADLKQYASFPATQSFVSPLLAAQRDSGLFPLGVLQQRLDGFIAPLFA